MLSTTALIAKHHPAQRTTAATTPPLPAITTGTARDPQDASEQDDTQEEATETAEDSNEVASSTEESDSPDLSEKLPTKNSKEEREKLQEEKQEEIVKVQEEIKEEEQESPSREKTQEEETSTSSDDGVPAPVSGIAAYEAKQAEPRQESRTGVVRSATVDDGNGRRTSSGPSAAVEELKFLEDLLLSDIQTALARLRETLEHTDVATLAKHGGVSDPSSKLHLLRLVSSLLSRLQVPEQVREAADDDNKTVDVAAQGLDASFARKRRPVRHTIGVSAEELARARKQLEESSVDLARLNDQVFSQRREPLLAASYNATNGERHVEEIRDKYTKDVINQRQSLRDKNKDPRGDTVGAYRAALVPPQIGYTDCPVAGVPLANETPSTHQPRRRGSVDSYQEKESDDEETARKANEEQNRVTKLAAVLRQRAELLSAGKCGTANGNRFSAKKSKIKRANTVDIPSYLKLQAESLGSYDNPCVLLRRPINVGDKVNPNSASLAVVPSFEPKTENDKKFLALISRNNETQPLNATPAFVKSFGYTKTMDMSSLTNENWNSRFSNIKTAFDKPSIATNDGDKLIPKSPQPAKRLPTTPQTSPQTVNNKKTIGAAHNGFPFANPNASKSDAGFRHAPSSLFRKIEKPQSSKSPSSCHWQRDNNVQSSGITLREKAKIMFDRDSNPQFQPGASKFHASEHSQKSTFPRPPWIEHERNEGKSGNMVTENGRLDYRLFCKQFAPFIGKGNVTTDHAKPQNIEESRKRDKQQPVARCKDFAPSNERLGIVDGKISFRMFPEKRPQQQVQQYRPSEPHREEPIRDKFDPRSEKDIFVPSVMRNDKNSAILVDATLKGSSSVAIQTGVNSDDHLEEARVFRVAPRAPRGPPSTYNNASVQTQNEPEAEPWMVSRYEDNPTSSSSHHPAEDPRHFVLDHNQNYHTVVSNVAPQSEISPLLDKNACNLVRDSSTCASNPMENVSSRATCGYHSPEQSKQIFQATPQYENYVPPKPPSDDRSQMYASYVPYVESIKSEDRVLDMSEIDRGDLSRPSDDVLPSERHIQNQDISADAGVVTRYTCAIATVASTDIPEARSEPTTAPESEASSSSSPSHLWPRPSVEVTTTEDEVRRHNMLQQSLVRRLQNERTMLNEYRPPIPVQSDNLNQPSNFNRSKVFNQPRNFNQPSNFNQPPKFQPPVAPKRLEAPRKLEPPKIVEPIRKVKPPAVIGLLSVAPSSGFSATNRVTALREQYEQPSDQTKSPVHKERSPIPNGVSSSMDSSDEYLVNCVNKPSRSIVLSKSESWHQLALSGSQQSSSRALHGGLPPPYHPSSSHLLKPPKPKSPSSFKMKKQYEASSSSDSVKRMEDKIRRYFDNPTAGDSAVDARDSKNRRFSSRDSAKRSLIGLSRSRTLPGVCDERLRLTIPASPQIPAGNLNTAEVEKVFDDIFEEATKADDHRF
ncbi:hypothetical protein DMN91_001293 [Ooceraea biroi]|uniref:Uncharacterized protein n=2 Tax=Ooceraea biroi TaxID=2015173 RepID=A0A3L8E630_OOCBI|nr:hypothetical protein DMN91_001293 [Ooceraea biroi]